MIGENLAMRERQSAAAQPQAPVATLGSANGRPVAARRWATALTVADGLLLAVAAWALFLRRDIRVGGERGWGAGFLTQGRGDLTQGR